MFVMLRTSILMFFQAEDGIRYIGVTGVQTCALPISAARAPLGRAVPAGRALLGAHREAEHPGSHARISAPLGPAARRVGHAQDRDGGEIGRASCRERV